MMDGNKDDKSIVEKTVDVVKEFAAGFTEAAHKAVKSKPTKSDDEIIMMPSAPTGFMDDAVAPPLVLVRKKTKSRKTRAKVARKTARKTTSAKAAKAPARRQSVARKTNSSKKTKTKKSRR